MAKVSDTTQAFMAGPFNLYFRLLRSSLNTSWYPLGILDETGLTINQEYPSETITGDNMGATIQDGIYQGVNATLTFTLKQARSLALTSLANMATLTGTALDASDALANVTSILEGAGDDDANALAQDALQGRVTAPGTLWSCAAAQLFAEPIYGNTPVGDKDASGADCAKEELPVYFFGFTVLQENSTIRYALNHQLRTVPITMRLLPFTGIVSTSQKHLWEKMLPASVPNYS